MLTCTCSPSLIWTDPGWRILHARQLPEACSALHYLIVSLSHDCTVGICPPGEHRAHRPCRHAHKCFDRPAKQESDFPPLVAVAWIAEVLQHHVHAIKAA